SPSWAASTRSSLAQADFGMRQFRSDVEQTHGALRDGGKHRCGYLATTVFITLRLLDGDHDAHARRFGRHETGEVGDVVVFVVTTGSDVVIPGGTGLAGNLVGRQRSARAGAADLRAHH